MTTEIDEKLKTLGIPNPQESVAKAIDRLSSNERIKMMSNLKHSSDVQKYGLMYSVGEEVGYKWLINLADTMLMLNVSLDKGRGRKDIVEIVRQPLSSLGQGIKEKIQSFIRSE
jgi:hypothetical protein